MAYTIYASVTYSPNNGSSSYTRTYSATSDNPWGYVTFSLAGAPSYSGHTFDGWDFLGGTYGGGATVSVYGTTATESYSADAMWTAVPTTYDIGCQITWDNNGGTPSSYSSNPRNPSSSTSGASLGTSTPINAPTRSGYTFDGWYVGGSLIGTGQPITVWCDTSFPSYTFSASWTPITYTVTVTFDANGGTPAPSPATVTETYSAPDTYAEITMPAAPSKPGHNFEGWGTQLFNPGRDYPFTAGTYTLVAQYSVIPVSGKVKVYTSSGWKTATPWIYTAGGWEQASGWVYTGNDWVSTDG